MKRLILLILLVFTLCLTGCGVSPTAPVTPAPEAVTSETENQTESEKVSEQSQPVPPISAIETVPAETENPPESEQPSEQPQPVLPETSESELQREEETTDMIRFTVGESTFFAKLENNASAKELKELLKNGPITMSASNYGGFEKVCSLGTRLTSNDVQTTTQAGDIMLYSSNQIVIFYGSNSWAYTRLAKVVDDNIQNLKTILSGSDSEVVIELAEK